MSLTPPADVPPDFAELGVHALELARGISRCANLPAFTDPNISTKLNKLDDVTQNIDTLKRDLTAALTTALTAALTGVITQSNNALKTELTKKIDDLRKEAKESNTALKTELTKKIDDLRKEAKESNNALKTELRKEAKESNNALKTELTKEIKKSSKALERKLSNNIAAREMNALARQRNNVTSQSSYKLMPLYSVLTNAPIEDFPKSVSQFRKLPNQTVLQILQELDDPFHQPNYDTASRRGRLAMLIGIRSSDGPVLHPLANAAGAGDASDDGDDGDSGDDDDDDDDDDDGGA